jgi:cytochrome P450
MVLSIYLSTFLATLLSGFCLCWLVKRNQKLPPGPLGVPLLGYLPFLDLYHLGQSFADVGKRYGDIFSLRIGTEIAVVLNSYDAIKKAFSNPLLCDRPDTFMFQFFSQGNNGLASTSGEKWKVQRKFAHTTLKKFGFGRPQMEAFVQDEAADLIRILKEKCGGNKGSDAVEIGYDINVSVVNVIWSLISGERKSHDDAKIREFLESVNKSIELSTTSGILLFFPFLAKIFPEKMFGIDQVPM